jgi:hypothetical protein
VRVKRGLEGSTLDQNPTIATAAKRFDPFNGHVPRSSRTASDPVALSTIHPTWVMPFIHGVQMMGRRSDPASKTPGNCWR